MKVTLLRSAIDDLQQGYAFYERQQRALGAYFERTLLNEIRALSQNTGVHKKVYGYHRMLSKRFPYAIFYDIKGQSARVWAVLDCRREPERMRERLTKTRAGR